MKIIVNEKNRDRIDTAIKEAEGPRVKVRVMDYNDMVRGIAQVERRLRPLPKKEWVGATAQINAGHAVPNSYYGRAERTEISIERFPTGWAIIGASRERCPSASYGQANECLVSSITITTTQRDQLLSAVLSARRINVAKTSE